jgi:hypothetical protein
MMSHQFENARQLPALYFMIQDLIKDNLDSKWFPWVKDPPATPQITTPTETTRKKPSWATRKSAAQSQSQEPQDLRENGARVLVFVLGGATYSELRVCDALQNSEKRQVLLGSTHLWTPDSFVEALKDFNIRGGSTRFYGYKRPIPKAARTRVESTDSSQNEGRSNSGYSRRGDRPAEHRPRTESSRGDSKNDNARSSASKNGPRPSGYVRRSDSNDAPDRSPNSGRRPLPPPRRTATSQDQRELDKDMSRVSVKDKTGTEEKKKRWFGF